jgi:oligoribonuclease NrnB/cAMP/cGMP phosphodiesterase (DHH superfamily)
MKAPLIIYHGKCADGFTAAWIAKKALAKYEHADAELHSGVYGDPLPDVDGRHVFVLDFSYPRAQMQELIQRAEVVIWLDHHATAIKESGDLCFQGGWCHADSVLHSPGGVPKCVGDLRTERSGAWLTWEWFYGPDSVPHMVELVDDRDRWVFNFGDRSRQFAAGLFSRNYTEKDWDEVAADVEGTVRNGEVILVKHWKDIREALDVCTVFKVIDGLNVPTANLNYMSASDACHELLERYPGAQFAACWFLRSDGKNVYSLRSRNGSDVDVGAIAKKFGGGGHRHASGFAIAAELDKGPLVP